MLRTSNLNYSSIILYCLFPCLLHCLFLLALMYMSMWIQCLSLLKSKLFFFHAFLWVNFITSKTGTFIYSILRDYRHSSKQREMGIELQRDGRRNEKLKAVVNTIARFSSLDDSVDFTKNFSELALSFFAISLVFKWWVELCFCFSPKIFISLVFVVNFEVVCILLNLSYKMMTWYFPQ